jgi:membrane dipeptidase
LHHRGEGDGFQINQVGAAGDGKRRSLVAAKDNRAGARDDRRCEAGGSSKRERRSTGDTTIRVAHLADYVRGATRKLLTQTAGKPGENDAVIVRDSLSAAQSPFLDHPRPRAAALDLAWKVAQRVAECACLVLQGAQDRAAGGWGPGHGYARACDGSVIARWAGVRPAPENRLRLSFRATAHILSVMRWVDGHLDLAYLAVNGRDLTRRDGCDPATGCVTLPALREAGVAMAFATIFTQKGLDGPDRAHRFASSDDRDGAEAAGLRQIEVYERLQRDGHVRIIRSALDLEISDDRLSIVLLMEGADPIRSPEDVPQWHARGLRMVGLAWADGSRYAGGNGPPPGETGPVLEDTGPLTSAGIAMIRALDEAGIMHDASHLSDAALDGLLEYARGPVVATHSNCRALLDDWQRHLRDDHIRAIAARDGVIGLNLFTRFLALGRRGTIDDCVAHVEHVAEVAGRRDIAALGSDMDGGFRPDQLPVGLDHPAKLDRLAEALRSRGWGDADVAGFAWGNWMRLLRETFPRDDAC